MQIFRFLFLFGGPSRTGLHTFILKNHIIFLIWCTAVASPAAGSGALCFSYRVRRLVSLQTLVRVSNVHYR